MKKITLGIVIGIALSLGGMAFAQAQIKLIMVPEYIGNYSTLDLLNYLASLKARSQNTTIKPIIPLIKPEQGILGNASA